MANVEYIQDRWTGAEEESRPTSLGQIVDELVAMNLSSLQIETIIKHLLNADFPLDLGI